MIRFHVGAALALALTFSAAANARDYVLPSNVTVLSENQIVDLLIGNTAFNRHYSEYHEPPAGERLTGGVRGRHKLYGPYTGKWSLEGPLMCWEFYKPPMSSFGGCFTLAPKGELTILYGTDGYEYFPRGGRIKIVPGNPGNL